MITAIFINFIVILGIVLFVLCFDYKGGRFITRYIWFGGLSMALCHDKK